MRLIINASGTKATGVTQVTVSFIRECLQHPENQYFLFLSHTVAEQLNQAEFSSNFHFYIFAYKPFFNVKGIRTWLRLVQLEKEIQPDCVFSVFGPSVWQPKAPHLMGYAYPYYIYTDSPFFSIISVRKRLTIKMHRMFHKYFFERNGEHYVSETLDVTSRLPKFLKCKAKNLYTVTNTYNDYFNNFTPQETLLLPKKKHNEFRFVTLSSFASHKNLTVLNDVIPILRQRLQNIDVKFVLTVDAKLFIERLNCSTRSQIYNLGRIPVSSCPQAYLESDAMFLPTLMECFSASYAESMKMGKPIATSDLPFAKTVCDEAAVYFNPTSPTDIAEKLIELITDPDLREDKIEKGFLRLNSFDTPASRANKYLTICKKLVTQ